MFELLNYQWFRLLDVVMNL